MNDYTDLPDRATGQPDERGYLVGINIKRSFPLLNVEDSLDELTLLAQTAGIEVAGRTFQQLEAPNPATYIGSGKVEAIKETITELGINVVIFDDELSPRHQRELEKAFGEEVKVLDRSALILDIFAQHAQTREGALQVELAQYEYRLPRLTRQWTHLARQTGGGTARGGSGGVGLRGPGETQLEVDRREIGRRISKLKEEIEAVRAHRERYRRQRAKERVPVIALVGYTNAGKSTLLNQLSGANIYAADQLFATLDPTTRRVVMPGGMLCLFSDTVGFIQKLPTTLIAAFRATLEEVAEATVIVHVADASHPNILEQIESVEDTLAEIDVPEMPRILALNKTDRLSKRGLSTSPPEALELSPYEAVVPISAKTGMGLNLLLAAIESALAKQMQFVHLLVPYHRGDVTARIYEHGVVTEEQHTDQGVLIKAQLPHALAAQVAAVADVVDCSKAEDS